MNEDELTKKQLEQLIQVKNISPRLKEMHELKEKIIEIFNQYENDEMQPEYNFSTGIQAKYTMGLISDRQVILDPDVAAVFNNSAAVNEALRMLLKIASSMKTSD